MHKSVVASESPVSWARKQSLSKTASAIQGLRQELAHNQVTVHSLAKLMVEAYDFEIDDPDLGYCCKAVSDILLRVGSSLDTVTATLKSATQSFDPMTVAEQVDEQREQLFRAHAVVHATAKLFAIHHRERGEVDVSVMLESVNESLDDITSVLESFGSVAVRFSR